MTLLCGAVGAGAAEGPAPAPGPVAPSRLDLSGTWKLTWTDGGHGPQSPSAYAAQPMGDPGRYIDVPVPMELHRVFQSKGLLDDPNFGINSLKARWVGEQFYQYQTAFDAPPAALAGAAWLVFDLLDLGAEIFLNGESVGRHANAHRPCRIEVTGRLKPGRNLLAVAIESGLYGVAEKEGMAYSNQMDAALNKRHWLRKAQYQFLWDWNPRLINVGITGPVGLEWAQTARLDQVAVTAAPAADFSSAEVLVRPFVETLRGGATLVIRAAVRETGESAEIRVTAARGLAAHPVAVRMASPKLWWPAGQGEPALYTLDLSLSADGRPAGSVSRRFGVRRVEIDQTPVPSGGRHFFLRVNGRPVFAKGGNWVPADMIQTAADRTRIRRLVDLAVRDNFNLLRIWGGGTFAGHDLLEACDEAGLLVWHDFLFACAKYPADDPAFLDEVKREAVWAVREFAHHPSLAVWCGANELEWGAWDWGYAENGRSLPDYALYHLHLPRILAGEDPGRPYWPSSPYSPDGRHPNDPTVGDQHPWEITLGETGPDFWAYRGRVDRFPNEGGVLGASSPKTLRQFLPEGQRSLRSFTWEHHDNAANFWKTELGIAYKTVSFWTGRDPFGMGLEDYAFASALLQAEGLSEYIANYRRRMFTSGSAIFWMFNDSWPVAHGWTVVDYYLRKKVAFHPVRRAFAPVSVVLAEDGGSVRVFGVNDSPAPWRGVLRHGFFGMLGGLPVDRSMEVTVPPNASTELARLDRAAWDGLGVAGHGAFAMLSNPSGTVASHRLFAARFKDLAWNASPAVAVTREGANAVFRSPVFVWGAVIDPDGEADLPDDCFDILPGLPHAMPWPADKALPAVRRTGNDIFKTASLKKG